MTPLRMLQKRFLQIHVSLLHEHGDDASILDVGVFVEFVADGLLGFWEGEVYVVDCEDAWEFSVDGNWLWLLVLIVLMVIGGGV